MIERLVIRGSLGERVAQEGPQGQAVRTTPRDAAFGVDALEIADQQHAEVDPRRNARPTDGVVVELRAEPLGEVVEPSLGEELVELAVERMPRSSRHVRARDPEFLLPLSLPFAHRHRIVLHDFSMASVYHARQEAFFNGLLGSV